MPYTLDAGIHSGLDMGSRSRLGSEQVHVVADLHSSAPQSKPYWAGMHSSVTPEEDRLGKQDERNQILNLQTLLRSQSTGSIDPSYPGSKLTQRNVSTSYLAGVGIPQSFISSPTYPDPTYPLSRLPDPLHPLSRLQDSVSPLSRLQDSVSPLSRLQDSVNPLSRLLDPNRSLPNMQDTQPPSHVIETPGSFSQPGNYSGNMDCSKPSFSQFSKQPSTSSSSKQHSTSPTKQGLLTSASKQGYLTSSAISSPSRIIQGFLPNKILSGFVAGGSTNIAPISAKPGGFQSQPNLIGLPKLSTVSTYAVHEDNNNKKNPKIFNSGLKPSKPVTISSQINALVSPTRLVSTRISNSADPFHPGEPTGLGSSKPKSPPVVQPKPVLSQGSSRGYFSPSLEPSSSSFNISPIHKPVSPASSSNLVSSFKPVPIKPQVSRHHATESRQPDIDSRCSSQVETRDCVYLRPGQNIPDGFNCKFKPISGEDGGEEEEKNKTELYTSSDDIVLTLRSVQV